MVTAEDVRAGLIARTYATLDVSRRDRRGVVETPPGLNRCISCLTLVTGYLFGVETADVSRTA